MQFLVQREHWASSQDGAGLVQFFCRKIKVSLTGLNQAQYEAGSLGMERASKFISTQRSFQWELQGFCVLHPGAEIQPITQRSTQLPSRGITALIPLVPLCALEKENSTVVQSLRSQGMLPRFSDNIFHLFSGIPRRESQEEVVYGFLPRYLLILKM